jgi:hypothetical protein
VSQPALGVTASALVVALSLAYVSLFDFPTFAGPVAFFMLALIPPQIVLVVLAPDAPFAAGLRQPARGLVLLAVTAAAAVVLAPVALWLTGEGAFPPGPIPSHYAVIVVPTTFFLAIAFAGWPFTILARNRLAAAVLVLVAAYALTYAIFRVFFDYEFLEGAPVYLSSAPRGRYHASWALVFDVTALAGMFLLLHFDLWPLTRVPALRRQPALGVVWLIVSLAVAALVMRMTMPGSLNLDPMWVLTRVTAPFIFGTIIVLNMLQNSLMARLSQPLKGVANTVVAAAVGLLLANLYGVVAPWIAGRLPMGWPGYEYEIWLVNALLSVTFPFLVFHAAYFGFWPLAGGAAAAESARP